MSRYKPGSRISQMWAMFESKGLEATLALGTSLSLAPSTIKAWCRMWSKESAPPKEKDKEKATAPKVTHTSAVKVVWTKRPVRLMVRGEQCSEVCWMDTGSHQTLPNDQIKF